MQLIIATAQSPFYSLYDCMKLSKLERYSTIILSVGSVLTLRKIFDILYRKYYNYPSGSCGLPIIGSLTKIFNYKHISNLTTRYGSIFMVYAGFTPIIFINDLKIANIYLENENIQKKKKYVMNTHYLNGVNIEILKLNLLNKLNEKSIKNQQYFEKEMISDLQFNVYSLFHLRIFGKYNMIKYEDYAEFMPVLNKFCDKFLHFLLFKAMFGTNKISLFIFDKLFKSAMNKKILIKLCGKWLNEFERNYVKNGHFLIEWLNNNCNQNKIQYNECMIIEWYKQYTLNKITRKQIICDIGNIMINDIDSIISISVLTAAIIVWLCVFPEIEEKIYNELKLIQLKYGKDIKNNKLNYIQYIEELHILRAFIFEVFRFPGKASFGDLPRIITDDGIKINGYNIPKYSLIVIGFDQFGHDIKCWQNPFQFDINNFLDKNNRFKNNICFNKFNINNNKKEIYLLLIEMILNYRFYTKQNILNNINIPNWNTITSYSYIRNNIFDKIKIFVEKRDHR